MTIARVSVNWTGWPGAPGYTNLYFRDFTEGPINQAIVDGAVLKTDTWLDAWVGSVPQSVSFTVNPTVEEIDETTGTLVNFWTAAPDTVRVGGDVGVWSGTSGACVNWYTNGIRNGRRIRGRTFMVPLGQTAYENNGTLAAARLLTLRAANQTLISESGFGDLGVWSRPSAPGATDGVWYFASATTMADKAAVLRSRRD